MGLLRPTQTSTSPLNWPKARQGGLYLPNLTLSTPPRAPWPTCLLNSQEWAAPTPSQAVQVITSQRLKILIRFLMK
jgi:hypothetical protein